jgi:hypothetical protein
LRWEAGGAASPSRFSFLYHRASAARAGNRELQIGKQRYR